MFSNTFTLLHNVGALTLHLEIQSPVHALGSQCLLMSKRMTTLKLSVIFKDLNYQKAQVFNGILKKNH